jgi:hypothetical protein
MIRPSRPRYITVDLDLHSSFPLHDLVAAFGDNAFALHCGEGIAWPGRRACAYAAVMELNIETRGLNETLRGFCALIESLPAAAAALWKKVRRREFNIGFDSGVQGPAFNTAIAPDVITRIAKLGGSIAVTIYPVGQSTVSNS